MDAFIVLGCKLARDCTSKEILGRSLVAAQLLLENRESIAVASGGRTELECEKSEARVIADILEKEGIQQSRIMLEEKSSSTLGNAFYTREILTQKEINISKIYIVTSCYHARRSQMIFSNFFSISVSTEFCFSYDRADQNESEKYLRDYEILQKMNVLNDRAQILKKFAKWL